MVNYKLRTLLLFLLAALTLSGCGMLSQQPYTVSGRITYSDDNSVGIEGVSLAFSGSSNFGTAVTNADGTWSKSDLRGTVTVYPAKRGWTITPRNRQVTGTDDNVDFRGEQRVTYTPTVAQVSSNTKVIIARKYDGTVWGWGDNVSYQLGEFRGERQTPIRIAGISGVVAIDVGTTSCIALKGDGTVWVWGMYLENYPELGITGYTIQATPKQVANLDGITAVAVGRDHSIALKSDGTVWIWGSNSNSQLGLREPRFAAQPIQVPGLSNVKAIAAGEYHSIALKHDGSVWAWGSNSNNQLGIGLKSDYAPVQIPNLGGVIAIASGKRHNIALKADGTVWAWGDNNYVQVNPSLWYYFTVFPAMKVPKLSSIVSIAAGDMHSLALDSFGRVWAWGSNSYGQLGVSGSVEKENQPYQVKSLSGIERIGAGGYYSTAIDDQGALWQWGGSSNVLGGIGNPVIVEPF